MNISEFLSKLTNAEILIEKYTVSDISLLESHISDIRFLHSAHLKDLRFDSLKPWLCIVLELNNIWCCYLIIYLHNICICDIFRFIQISVFPIQY